VTILETWKPVVGWLGYEVSDLGRVRSWKSRGRSTNLPDVPRIRKLQKNPKTGYLYVMLSEKGEHQLRQVHVMVLEAFRGPCPAGMESRHLDNDETNNCLGNLVYGTRRDQFDDQVRAGTDTRGERNGAAKLTNAQAVRIRERLAAGEKGSTLAREYGVLDSTITRIKKGARYASSV
jgi:hypothetical protein